MEKIDYMEVLKKIENLRSIAKKLIVYYIQNNSYNKNISNDEIERIIEIINHIPISIRENKSIFSTKGLYDGKKIIIDVNDINKFIFEEINSVILTLIHELYHAISKNNFERQEHFLEEGYITEITAETIRYAIENSLTIIKKEDLIKGLNTLNVFDYYRGPSELVRSIQVIMKQYGYNSMLEYIFSGKGSERLYEIAKEIEPKLADIIKKQHIKSPVSINYVYEREFLKKLFDGVNLTDISETEIETNLLLQEYLIDKELITQNPKLCSIVKKFNSSYKLYKLFHNQNINLTRGELPMKIKKELEEFDFEYQTQYDITEVTKKMFEIINFGYEQSSVNPKMFDTKIYFAKFIAFDLYQRGIKQPPQIEIIKKYINKLYVKPIEKELLIEMVNLEINKIYEQASKGIKISSIINETIVNQTFFGILANKELDDVNNENYWEKIRNVAYLILEQKEKNGENFYILFYNIILEMTNKYINLNPDKIYNENDFVDFRNRMTVIFDIAGVPIEFMNKIGLSVDKIFLKVISENIKNKNKSEQMKILLECIKNNNMHLGKYTNDLQDFTFEIYEIYEDLKNNDDLTGSNQFILSLLEIYYNKGLYDSTKIDDIREDPNIKKILDDFELTPQIYFDINRTMQIFQKYPELYERIRYRADFYKKIISYLPEEMQIKLKSPYPIMMYKINKVVIGKEFPKVEDYAENRLNMVGLFAKFFIIYDGYIRLIENDHIDEAKELMARFYGKSTHKSNNCDVIQEENVC